MQQIIAGMLSDEGYGVAHKWHCQEFFFEVAVLGLQRNQLLHNQKQLELREL